MKICPKCQTANSNTAITCKECSASVSAEVIINADELLRKEMQTVAVTERKRDAVMKVAVMLLSGLHLLFVLLALTMGRGPLQYFLLSMLVPVAGLMEVLSPDDAALRRRDTGQKVIVGLIIGLHLILFILALTMGRRSFWLFLLLLLTSAAGYLGVLHPDILFLLSHLFLIDNLEDVKPSNWYCISSRLGGYLLLTLGAIMTAAAVFS